MKVYFSGIAGTGIGPLAEFAQDAGFEVFGSDLKEGAISPELEKRHISVSYGEQTGEFLNRIIEECGVDWFVYTSALPQDAPELVLAREKGIKTSKRDEFIAELVRLKNLKMIAVAGTHGKTTTTSMLAWCAHELNIPASYLVGTTLPWSNGGHFDSEGGYFIYEADEYDRNFLAYHPYIAAIVAVDYDHPDIYPTREDYLAAFAQFESQSDIVVKNTTVDSRITLVGELRRHDASLALEVLKKIYTGDEQDIISALNNFPGAGRRFERVADRVYTDYGHHPEEIRATVEMAAELKTQTGAAGLAIVYQPHQNTRQHEVRHGYKNAFIGADKIFWLPTYLTRENPNLAIITPEELISELDNKDIAVAAEANDSLAQELKKLHDEGWIVLLMTAGPADTWFRNVFAN